MGDTGSSGQTQRTITSGQAKATLFDHVAAGTKADMRAVWRPTASGFFGRMKGPWLEALYCDLLKVTPDDPGAVKFSAMKKAAKAEWLDKLFADPAKASTPLSVKIDKDTIARVAAWRPTDF